MKSANQLIYERNEQQQTVMGTTMTAALVSESTAYVVHVGDSRLYLYREPAGLVQVTRDLTIAALLLAAGTSAPDDIYTHPKRNQIYRSLGSVASVEVDVTAVQLADGDSILLCSDGLWELVCDQQIAAIVTTSMASPSQRLRAPARTHRDCAGAIFFVLQTGWKSTSPRSDRVLCAVECARSVSRLGNRE